MGGEDLGFETVYRAQALTDLKGRDTDHIAREEVKEWKRVW